MGGGVSKEQKAAPSRPPVAIAVAAARPVVAPKKAASPKKGAPPAARPVARASLPAKISAGSLADFEMKTTLGKGSFGRVRLCQHRASGAYWACKAMHKTAVVRNNAFAHLRRETEALTRCEHPFVVNMACAFQDERRVYLILEFVQGGALETRLRGEGRLTARESSFYGAQIALAFEYLHSLNFVFRDLKPDNLLVDMTGYLKLTDFGFAKECQVTHTLCGTPDYMAPEILAAQGYGKAVDWWALGVVLCELLTGKPCFVADTPDATYALIRNNAPKFGDFPKEGGAAGKACVKRLLTVGVSDRLGCGKSGVREIKKHKFFKAIVWDKLLRRELTAPHEPFVNFEEDTSNFDEYPDSKEETSLPDYGGEPDPFADFA